MSCTCKDNKEYPRGDWSFWRQTCGFCKSHGFSGESFVRYTDVHIERIKKGLSGSMTDGREITYFYSNIITLPWLRKYMTPEQVEESDKLYPWAKAQYEKDNKSWEPLRSMEQPSPSPMVKP